MKHTHLALVIVLLLVSCGDSKPPPQTPTPAAPDVGVAATAVRTEAVASRSGQEEALFEAVPSAAATGSQAEKEKQSEPATSEASTAGASEAPSEKPAEEHSDDAKSSTQPATAKKHDTTTVKEAETKHPEPAAPAKVEELSVQVLQEGTGRIVKLGDTVTLEYTISYMPKAGANEKDEPKKKDAKSSKKSSSKKPDDKKSEEAKPKDEVKEVDKAGDEKKAAGATASHEAGGDKQADPQVAAKEGDKQPEPKPKEAKPNEPLKPVIVASTKSWITPFTAKLENNGKPKLIPGLVRGLEGLKVGTRARILVPAALAYGKDGNKSAGIPADTPVEIEVFVKDARE